MAGQSVRPSQFITNYGPGSLLETSDGPGIMADFLHCTLFDDPNSNIRGRVPDISKYEIVDKRLSTALLGGASIFGLPSNEELNALGASGVYRTYRFPSWSLCVRAASDHGPSVIYRLTPDFNRPKNEGCPECGPLPTQEAWRKSRREAITFVRACTAGHLDDIMWFRAVPHKRDDCLGVTFNWIGTGSSLANITIECRDCGGSTDMRTIFTSEWPCTGRFPEAGDLKGSGQCDRGSVVLLKGAANLRIPDIVTALTIPPNDTNLHTILGRSHIQTALRVRPIATKRELVSLIHEVPDLVRPSEIAELEGAPEGDILRALSDLKREAQPSNLYEMKVDEFQKLVTAATHGAPPVPGTHPSMPHQFEVLKKDVRTISRPGGHDLRITPVNRLRVVMVQKGYSRPVGGRDNKTPVVVERPYNDGVRNWYPGVELSGEGIFVDFPDGMPLLKGRHADEWLADYNTLRSLPAPERHPAFVWWHTYSHRLLAALSVDSGYAAASIRERVFLEIDERTGRANGGVLLYTSTPGGDGTLGGLVALVPDFETILDTAENYVDSCSNDPICYETEFRRGQPNGAACYACQMASETSCEHRNANLDRNLLKDNMP